MLQTLLLSSLLAAASAWVVPTPAGFARGQGVCAARCAQRFCMQEDAAASTAADQVSDFTEDLLDALTADDASFADTPAETFKGNENAEMESLTSFVNERSVEELRAKYKLHENDSGSAQVQVAVLTARIAYMTKHMATNKKDYASLRGLTAMVTRRRKLLEWLLREDLAEFKRITSELGIRTNQLLKPKASGARGRRV